MRGEKFPTSFESALNKQAELCLLRRTLAFRAGNSIFRQRRWERRKPPYPLGVKPALRGGLSHPKPPRPCFFPRHSPAGSPLLRSVRGDSASAAERWGGINSEREEPAPAQHSPARSILHPRGKSPPAPQKALGSPPVVPPGRYGHGGQRRRPNRLENRSVWTGY